MLREKIWSLHCWIMRSKRPFKDSWWAQMNLNKADEISYISLQTLGTKSWSHSSRATKPWAWNSKLDAMETFCEQVSFYGGKGQISKIKTWMAWNIWRREDFLLGLPCVLPAPYNHFLTFTRKSSLPPSPCFTPTKQSFPCVYLWNFINEALNSFRK